MPRLTAAQRRLLSVAAVTIAALLAWWRPWSVAGEIPVPTMIPATATRAPERIALPTPPPTVAPPRTPTLGTPAPANPATPAGGLAGVRDRLLYLGYVGGRLGVVVSRADGAGARLLTEGDYTQLVAAHNGDHFATAGPLPGEPAHYQVALFAGNGQPLIRQSFASRFPPVLSWSPSGHYLLASITPEIGSARAEHWVFDPSRSWQVRSPAQVPGLVYGWSPGNRLTFLLDSGGRFEGSSLWTTDATGGDARQLHTGLFTPVGWSRDGTRFYFLNSAQSGALVNAATELQAVEVASGIVSRVASADDLARVLSPTVAPAPPYSFSYAAISPDGSHLALALTPGVAVGTPLPRGSQREHTILFMRPDGRITGVAPGPLSGELGPHAWTRDGAHFALFGVERQAARNRLHLFSPDGRVTSLPAEPSIMDIPPQAIWSPDGSTIVYTSARGLVVIAPDPLRSTLLIPGGIAPAWQPARQP